MQDNYSDYNRRGTSPVAIGIVGAAIGAVLGVGAAMVLSDPQKRKRMEKKFQDMQKWGNQTLKELRENSEQAEETLKTAIAEKAERLQKEVDEAAAQSQAKLK